MSQEDYISTKMSVSKAEVETFCRRTDMNKQSAIRVLKKQKAIQIVQNELQLWQSNPDLMAVIKWLVDSHE